MKSTIISIFIVLVLILGIFLVAKSNPAKIDNVSVGSATSTDSGGSSNVSIVDGKQIIEIRAKGGYWPLKSIAKADIPTIIRFNTKGTFDCTAAVRIPALDISKNLPPSGVTDIPIGTPKSGILNGTCGMGMFPFAVKFE